MTNEQQFRNKIRWFTFLFSILVVWVHSVNAELFLGNAPAAAPFKKLESLVGTGLGQFAVPGFFMISAYLFYRNFSWEKLGRKWRSRARSLFLPFLLWNGLYYLGYVAASRVPGLADIVGKGIIPFDGKTALDAVFHYRYNYVFWYLYQLIWLAALTPVIYFFLRTKVGAAVYIGAAVLWVWLQVDFPFINEDSMLYYAVAAAFAVHRPGLAEENGGIAGRLEGAALMAAGGLCGVLYLRGCGVGFLVLCRLFVPLGLWRFVDGARLPEARPWMEDTFFLYATHFALVRLINKTGAVLFPGSRAAAAFLFVAMPWLCLGLSRTAAGVLKRWTPPLWSWLSGGRNG